MESNLTEKEREQARLIERAKREWEASVDALPQLICLLDRQQQVVRGNRTIERWDLGRVVEIKGKDVHALLHGACADPHCYLVSFLNQVWTELPQAQSIEFEADDKQLKRYVHLQIQPILTPLSYDEVSSSSQSFAVLVLSDITRQKQAELVLHQYAADLKAHNEELDAFAHTVAHDLKNPLGATVSYAQFLQKYSTKLSTEDLQKHADTIVRNGQKMNNIINELLLLASVRKEEVELAPLDMTEIVGEVQNRLDYMVKEAGAEIVTPEEWPVAWGYGPWVEEVWTNYVSNAIKYGGEPPRVELGATSRAEGMVSYWVQDNGRGLTREEQARLFIPFTRLNQVSAEGQGLGLSIVQRIVAKLGGQVGVESKGVPGQGSRFSFTLPRNGVFVSR